MSDVFHCPFVQQGQAQATEKAAGTSQDQDFCQGMKMNPVGFPCDLYWALPLLKKALDSDFENDNMFDFLRIFILFYNDLKDLSFASTACEAEETLKALRSTVDHELGKYRLDPTTGETSCNDHDGPIFPNEALEYAFLLAARDSLAQYLPLGNKQLCRCRW